jgi:hypothetical protein
VFEAMALLVGQKRRVLVPAPPTDAPRIYGAPEVSAPTAKEKEKEEDADGLARAYHNLGRYASDWGLTVGVIRSCLCPRCHMNPL